MPTIDYNQISALPITELIFSEQAARSPDDSLFNDYLKRANAVSTLPAAHSPANDPNANRPAPPKADAARPSASRDDAPKTKESSDREQANEVSSPADDMKSAAEDASSPKPNETGKEQNGVQEAKQDDPQAGDAKPAEKDAVKENKEKEKNKEEKNDSKHVAESAAAAQKNAAELPVIQDGQQAKVAGVNDAADGTTVETEASQEVVQANLQLGVPASKKENRPHGDDKATQSGPFKSLTQKLQEKLDAAGNPIAADNPADAMLDVAGDGNAKAKKIREAAAEAKNAQRKQKSPGERSANDSVQETSDSTSATVGKTVEEGGKSTSAASQASSSVMQSVLDVLKNAEKPAPAEESASSIADVRANPTPTSAKATAAREGGSSAAPASSDNSAYAIRAQFVQRVERAFAAMGNREGSVRLKLSPAELGVLKLEIGVHKGVMNARIEAETPAAKALLLDNLPDLRESLAKQNIHIQRFDVDLMDRSSGGTQQQSFDQSNSGSRQDQRSSQRSNQSDSAAAVNGVSAASPQRAGMGGGLNIIV